MFNISILEKEVDRNGFKVICINEHEFHLRKPVSFIESDLVEILHNLRSFLVEKDTSGIAKTLEEYKNINATLFRFMEYLCPKEFEDYCSFLCSYFFNELNVNKVTYKTILRYMKTNNVTEALTGKLTMRAEIINEITTPVKTIQKFLRERFSMFIVACQRDDIVSIRRLSPSLGDKSLIKRIYSSIEYKEIFEAFLWRVGEKLIDQEMSLSKVEIVRYIFKGSTRKHEVGTPFNQISRLNILNEVATHIYNTLSGTPSSYKLEDDIWILREKRLQGFRKHTLVYSGLSENDKRYLKIHIDELYKMTAIKYKALYKRVHAITTIIKHFAELPYNVDSIFNINYYHLLHLLDHLQQLKKADGQRYFKLPYIYNLYQQAGQFLDWYIEKIDSEQSNPFSEIKMPNIKSFSKSTNYIPEEVIEKIEKVMHELPDMYQNAWTIMMNTGLRFSDIQAITSSCITFDEEIGTNLFTYLNTKMESQRILSGESKYHTIPVSDIVVEAVENQKQLTSDLRLVADTDKIFVTINRHSEVVEFVGRPLATSINRLIKKYNIFDENKNPFHYTNHQCRKTVIVDLLSKGHSLRKVADYINHSERTSARYYRDVEAKKIADLDHKMFQELFEETISEEVKDTYNTVEKQALFKEIQLGSRETPEGHGTCVKHVSFGPCHKKKCVGCKMLISGPQKLPKWYHLYREQEKYLKELEEEYKNSGIENYQEYRDYQQESHLLNVYVNTIEKIENFAKRRGISIEQY
ncbi:tyrosine-type recombinase/integrase [Terribacillus saccharophilus]|uniref:tyrosine-type recombinase/integrase n=1 Tax=Terribacillus saccharophilus TaxID=361277 RepID=UPI0039820830